ncbi:MAG TPA: hypothetical protein DER56_02655 [Thermosipho africanus]|nr:hypothetical protein [Thermosipho africanus]
MNEENFEKVIPKIFELEEGSVIVPGTLSEEVGISMNDISLMLTTLAEIAVVNMWFMPMCHHCGTMAESPVRYPSDFNKGIRCSKCGETLNAAYAQLFFVKNGDIDEDEFEDYEEMAITKQLEELILIGSSDPTVFH